MNESSSSTVLTGFTSAAFTPPAVSSSATTTPVTERVPTGTTTRAPTAGVGVPRGTRYVSRLRVGTGTATWTNIGTSTTVSIVVNVFKAGAASEPASYPPTRRASRPDCAGGMPG